MNNLCKAMSDGVNIISATEASHIAPAEKGWRITSKTGEDLGRFDWVISSAPCVQTARLMPASFSEHRRLEGVKMLGCYSLMLGFEHPVALDWDAARVEVDPLAWIAVNATKPGRDGRFDMICQSSNTWAEANLENDQEAVKHELMGAFARVTGIDPARANYVSLHRWRYANVSVPLEVPYLLDAERKLAACGDWTGSGRVEAAFDSGRALAEKLRDIL